MRPVVRPPHVEAAHNLLFGKPKPDQFSCQNRFQTLLEGRKRHRAELNINMDEQYRQFLLTRNTNTNCLQKRFEELCVEEKNGRVDYGSIDEALSILEAEGQGIVNNAVRPGKSKVDADFEIEGPGPYDVADVKIPINWGKGNEDLKAAAERMGDKIVAQKLRMQDLGKTPLHIVDLRKLSFNKKLDYKQNLINTIRRKRNLKKKFAVSQTHFRTRLVLKNYLIAVQENIFIRSTLKQVETSLTRCGKIQKLKKKLCQNLKKSKRVN